MKRNARALAYLAMAGAVLLGFAVLLAPTARKSTEDTIETREFAAYLFDPLVAAPAFLAATAAGDPGLRESLEASAKSLGIITAATPEFRFDPATSTTKLHLEAPRSENVESFAAEAFRHFAQTYSSQPFRTEILVASLKYRDAGVIRFLGAPPADAAFFPVLLSSPAETSSSHGASAAFLPAAIAALAGLCVAAALYLNKTRTSSR